MTGLRETIGSYDPDRPHRPTGPLGPNPILFATGLHRFGGGASRSTGIGRM